MDLHSFIIIIYVTFFFWLLPPVRQYKTRYFWYFVVILLPDLLTLTIARLTQIASIYFIPVSAFLLLPVLLNFKEKKWINILILIFFLGLGIYATINAWIFSMEYFGIVHIVVLLIFIKHTLLDVAETGRLNIFQIVLIFYELTLIAKASVRIFNYSESLLPFYLTSIFQLLLAIFFFVYRADAPKLQIPLRKEN